jgi:phage terminase small subunit
MAGRKPLPAVVKKIKGTLQKCRANPHEPRPGGQLGEPPGMIIKTPSGILRRSPLMDVIRDLAQEMKGYETEMGFTPASRSRVQVPQDSIDKNDPWAEIAG